MPTITLIDIALIAVAALLLLGIAAVFTRDGDELIIPDETKVKFPQGTQIVCPNCDRSLAVAKRDTDGTASDDWDWPAKVPTGLEMRCPHDGWTYYKRVGKNLYLHTRQGWIG